MKASHTPIAFRILRAFCPPELCEEIEGDLEQRFERDVKSQGMTRAKWGRLWSVLRFFRPGINLRNKLSFTFFDQFMITNYFKVALRVMMRNKTFTSINIFGLALGITGAILLFTWIHEEFAYDQFHADKDRILKMWNRSTTNTGVFCWDVTPLVLAPTLQDQFASVESAISYAEWGDQLLFSVGEKKLMKSTGIYTHPGFLTMFSFPLLKGNSSNALNDPGSIVLTETFARDLFGDEDAFGKTVTILASGERFTFNVTGIMKDLPKQTSFHFEYVIPLSFIEKLWGGPQVQWGNNSVSTYVKLKPGADIQAFNEEVRDLKKKNLKDGQHMELFGYPLTKMRLYSRFENGQPAGGRIEIIRMLAILGVSLIAMACINFINLSTARAHRRSKEIAVRKVTGALRRTLTMQFLSESILVVFMASIASVGLAWLTLPLFNHVVEQNLTLPVANPVFWVILAAFVLLTGLLAGSYPALYLSAFRPLAILKGTLTASSRNFGRSTLVVIQFGMAVLLVISAIVVHQQIMFVQNLDAGYQREQLIYQYLVGDLGKHFTAYRNELLQSGAALSVTATSSPITQQWSNTSGIGWKGKDPQNLTNFERFYVDDNISTTAGLSIVAGRDMDLSSFPSDSSAVLLNEAAARAMGFENPLGEVISDGDSEWHVIGVVKDFILTSPFQKVEPVLLFGAKNTWVFNALHIKLNPDRPLSENVTMVDKLARKYNPEYPVDYQFVDEEYEEKFANLQSVRLLTLNATLLALTIAGLGLLGLSTHMTETRVKEIGIRKVLGGSVLSIVRLLSFTSLRPILLSIIVFSPLGWYVVNQWLKSYAYRIDVNIWMLLAAAVAIWGVGLSVISTQTFRAARQNPVHSLRNE